MVPSGSVQCRLPRSRGSMRLPSRTLLVLLAVVSLLSSNPGIAGAQSPTGAIDGVVVDQSGAVMPGVTVTVMQPATGLERTVVSDENGLFRVLLLPVRSEERRVGKECKSRG